MALKKQLTWEDECLLYIVEDPILCGEFLRSTHDGSIQQQQWPKNRFKYRWYQKDLLTDANEYIAVAGGRAIGKCSPGFERIYTTEGFKTLDYLYKRSPSFSVYTLNEEGHIVTRRAKVEKDFVKTYLTIETEYGKRIHVSENHPVLTTEGYVLAKDLEIEKHSVIVPEKLPWTSSNNEFNWYELRYLGYLFGSNPKLSVSGKLITKYKKQVVELKMIAKAFNLMNFEESDGIRLQSYVGSKHYGTQLLEELYDPDNPSKYKKLLFASSIPKRLKEQSLESLKIFLEAFFSVVFDFSKIKDGGMTYQTRFTNIALDVVELLMRFGIHARIIREEIKDESRFPESLRQFMTKHNILYTITIDSENEIIKFFKTFDIPGVSVTLPQEDFFSDEEVRSEKVTRIITHFPTQLYVVGVQETHNYISGTGVFVKNSILLEDMLIYGFINPDLIFKDGNYDQLLTTANLAQLSPLSDKVIRRITNSSIFKGAEYEINRSKGTIDVKIGDTTHRLYTRIAGVDGSANLVGLHVTDIFIDESQLFPINAFNQLLPTLNTWQDRHRLILFGVPNGMTIGNLLWTADKRFKSYKKYRIPAHENPYFRRKDNENAIMNFGGVDSDEYQQLVLGKHGSPIYSLIPKDSIKLEPFEIYSYRFGSQQKESGYIFQDFIKLKTFDLKYYENGLVLVCDTGYTDPSIFQILGLDAKNVWRTLVRIRLTRIPFPEQARIIDYLDDYYNFAWIGVDFGSGGGGSAIAQILQDNQQTKRYNVFQQKIVGVVFNEKIILGYGSDEQELTSSAKEFGGLQLAKMIEEKQLVFSQLDMEGVRQMENVTFRRLADRSLQFFVMGERGKNEDDHIFASYIVFTVGLQKIAHVARKERKRLFKTGWIK